MVKASTQYRQYRQGAGTPSPSPTCCLQALYGSALALERAQHHFQALSLTHLETAIEHAIIDGKPPVRRGQLGKDGQSAGARVDEHSEGLARRSHRDVDKVLRSHVVDRHRHMVDPVPACALTPLQDTIATHHYNTPLQHTITTHHCNTPLQHQGNRVARQTHTATRPAVTRSELHDRGVVCPWCARGQTRTGTHAHEHEHEHAAHDAHLFSDSSSGSRISTCPRCRLIIGILSVSVLPGPTGW